MNFHKTILLLIFSLSLNAADGGKVGLSFLKIGVDARSAAMGEAYTALADNAVASYWNPSGLALSEKSSVILAHSMWIADISHNFIAYQFLNGKNNLAVSVNYLTIPGIEIRDDIPSSEPLGTVDAQNMYLAGAYAFKYQENVAFGIQLKMLYEKYYLASARGFALDFGARYDNLIPDMNLGISVQNIGAMGKLDKKQTKLPLVLRTGLGYHIPFNSNLYDLIIAADFFHVFNDITRINFGAELNIFNNLSFRGGYMTGHESADLTFGLGVKYGDFDISYAYIPFNYNLGNNHRISVNFRFN